MRGGNESDANRAEGLSVAVSSDGKHGNVVGFFGSRQRVIAFDFDIAKFNFCDASALNLHPFVYALRDGGANSRWCGFRDDGTGGSCYFPEILGRPFACVPFDRYSDEPGIENVYAAADAQIKTFNIECWHSNLNSHADEHARFVREPLNNSIHSIGNFFSNVRTLLPVAASSMGMDW